MGIEIHAIAGAIEMTDAEAMRLKAEFIAHRSMADAEMFIRIADDLDRLAKIDAVLRENNCTPYSLVHCDAVRAIDVMAEQNLLPTDANDQKGKGDEDED